MVVPEFLTVRELGISGRPSLILPYIAFGLALPTLILTVFFRNISPALLDAARVDGAGRFRILWSIVLPVSRPALGTCAVFLFLNFWNEFPLALTLIRENAEVTLPLAIASTSLARRHALRGGRGGDGDGEHPGAARIRARTASADQRPDAGRSRRVTYRPTGVIPAVATPFQPDESLDLATFETLAGLLIDAGVSGLFVCGSQGEFYALSHAEHEAVAARAVVVAGSVPVLAGVGSISTRDAVALARRLEATGVTAVTVLPPSIIRLNQDEIRAHLEAVADAVAVPVVIYDHPARTGNGLSIETVLALAEHPRIVGLKDSAGDIGRTAELVVSPA